MSLLSRLTGKGKNKGSVKGQGRSSKENPSITILVKNQNPDEVLLTTLLIRLKDENPDQVPQVIRDMLDNKIPYKNIHFKKKPHPAGGTYVTCIFEQ